MKKQRNGPTGPLATISGRGGHAGLLLGKGVGEARSDNRVLLSGLLLLEECATGVSNRYAECIEVIDCVTISGTTKANTRLTVVFVNAGPDCAVLMFACHWIVSVEVLSGFAPRARQGYGPDKTS
jgi:hypothetical protein